MDSHEFVRSIGQWSPSGTRLGLSAMPVLRRCATTRSVTPRAMQSERTNTVVVAAVEVEGLYVHEEAAPHQAVEGGRRHHAVVAIGAVGHPADRHPVGVGGQ